MTVRRGFLYLGVFLLAVGSVTLLAEAGVLERTAVLDALSYWPLAIIAIGVGLVLRRTPAAIPGGMLAAATPGLLLGAMFVAVPALPTPCTRPDGAQAPAVTSQGSFGSSARVQLQLSCGDMSVTTAPGNAWRVDTHDGTSRRSTVTDTLDGLVVGADERTAHFGLDSGAVTWDVVLPTDPALDADVEVNAGRGRIDLAGAHLDRLTASVNAGELRLDLTDASVTNLDLEINAGTASVSLPASGDLTVNAGSLEVCVPDGMGLRLRSETAIGTTHVNGLIRRGDTWETADYATAQFHTDVSTTASIGSVDINPNGGCK